MKNSSKIWALFISIFTFVLGVVTTIFLGDSVEMTTIYPWAENIVTVTSFVISFVAFVFSMITYFSIDTVSSITSMDGNVLENSDYTIAYEEAVEAFKEAKTENEFFDLLMKKVKKGKTSSCMVFADNLQDIIDYIIWFAYIDLKNEEYRNKCKKMVDDIIKEQKRYEKMSNGINHLLEENVKLINYVLIYQQNKSQGNENQFSKLENIRGNMLKNPIAQIVYYDYLGLDYRRKAANILRACQDKNGEFTTAYMKAVKQFSYTEEQRKHFECLIERAEMCFEKAQDVAMGNVLWEGYILYNKARVDIMKHLMGMGKTYGELCEALAKTVKIRDNVAFLFQRNGAYLDTKFVQEADRAKELQRNFEAINL